LGFCHHIRVRATFDSNVIAKSLADIFNPAPTAHVLAGLMK